MVRFFLILLPFGLFGQYSPEQLDSIVSEWKKETTTDKNDRKVYELLNELYNQVLQSDKGELNSDMPGRINDFFTDRNSKNTHILSLFLFYQDYFAQPSYDPVYQLRLLTKLEKEIKEIYGEIPVIIYVYKVEALDSNHFQSRDVIEEGLKKYPDSVPLKVYSYLSTKDESLKMDLIQHHSRHWMVQQFNIVDKSF